MTPLDTVNLLQAEEGQGLVEYSLILLLVSIAAVATVTLFGTALSAAFGIAVAAFP